MNALTMDMALGCSTNSMLHLPAIAHEAGFDFDVSLANDAPIEPGMCFSVEPGIYIPEENIGVRIEDLVLITEDGCRVLNEFPKELTILPFPEE